MLANSSRDPTRSTACVSKSSSMGILAVGHAHVMGVHQDLTRAVQPAGAGSLPGKEH